MENWIPVSRTGMTKGSTGSWIPVSRAGMTPVFLFAINPHSLISYQYLFFLSSE
ncbi:hypothetical protein [Wolbachia endosymbiont of Psylliodes chrysocephala]|uniref:hypothetical protein n=1 Tax=Wolbachia endosymbiont of Psylliodes chrysocephala TaxID=2883236 RepID=UPI00209E42C6|nr:hypothetical protein [Wolbachia endosymbiont of Psylliodes chrysocephala]